MDYYPVYLYESDDEDLFLDSSRVENRILNLISLNKKQASWLNFLVHFLQTKTMEWEVIFKEKDFTQAEFIYTDHHGLLKAHFRLEVSQTEPFYPMSPPKLYWLGPKYEFEHLVPLYFIDPLLPAKWNFCTDLSTVFHSIISYTTPLISLSNRLFLTESERFFIDFIEATAMYPSKFDQSLPSWGIINDLTASVKGTHQKQNGTGYSSGDVSSALSGYYTRRDKLTTAMSLLCQTLNTSVSDFFQFTKSIPFFKYIESLIVSSSLQDLETEMALYTCFYRIMDHCTQLNDPGLTPLFISLINLWMEWKSLSLSAVYSEMESNIERIVSGWLPQFSEHFVKEPVIPTTPPLDAIAKTLHINDQYKLALKDKQYEIVPMFSAHAFRDKSTSFSNPQWIRRLMREWRDLTKNDMLLLEGLNSNIYVKWCGEENAAFWKVLFCPATGTPYSGGCFLFDMYIPPEYPNTNPSLQFITTGKGTVRFNPNLYNNGKVCLSLLGTWQGEAWDPKISNLCQLLLSVSTMIFVDDPYFNEPGYQSSKGTPNGTQNSNEYNRSIRNYTIEWAVKDMLMNPPEEFREIIYTHFQTLWKEGLESEYLSWCNDRTSHSNTIKQNITQCRNLLFTEK